MTTKAICACGRVEIEGSGAPIVSLVCYCKDCQEAARRIGDLPGAQPVLDADGGTGYVAYRKDRVKVSKGSELLKRIKLNQKSPTNRLVAGCCNTAMLLNFDDSKHWSDIYRSRVAGTIPPLEMRVCTKWKPDNGALPADVPSYAGYPFRFIRKLMVARIAMMFGR